MKNNTPDAIVVGAGFAGAVCARELADAGKQVLVLEKRPQIGGNMYDGKDQNGVMVHWFGPHIFHTDNHKVFGWLCRFTDWVPYEHRVLGKIQGKLVPIPFNFTSIGALFPTEKASLLKQKLSDAFPGKEKISVLELTRHGDRDIAGLGTFVFENVFVGYTAKQWGIPVGQVDTSVIDRVPVVLSYDDRYFQDGIQVMPREGYTELFRNILLHENIHCRVNTPACEVLQLADGGAVLFDDKPFHGPVVYTGAPDQLLGYTHGRLPYRSLDLCFEALEKTRYQKAAVVNYPNEENFTRITEFKGITGQKLENATTILREYPSAYGDHPWQEPYYPIENKVNRAQYEAYRKELGRWENLFLCGRLAQYQYYNMDAVIAEALRLSAKILEMEAIHKAPAKAV